MKHLQDLDLESNQLTNIPDELFILTKIERLNLCENQINVIANSFEKLQKLTHLDLSKNVLDYLPASLGKCSNLRTLKLSNNYFFTLPPCVPELINLTALDLNFCFLTKLPDSIGLLTNLCSLEVRYNPLTELPNSIGSLVNLELLDCGATAALKSLPNSIGECVKLQTIWAEKNNLSYVPESIGNLVQLQTLDLGENSLESVPKSIGDLENLTELSLFSNKLTRLPDSIGKLGRLVTLNLEDNNLFELPESIGGCFNLTQLYISNNMISIIPPSLGSLGKLEVINFGRNQLRDIPNELFSAKSISILNLCDNKIETIPQNVGNLPKLTILDLSGNKLKNLPYRLLLCPLKSIRLSDMQTRSMIVFQRGYDEVSGSDVLTSVYLPQDGFYTPMSPDSIFLPQNNIDLPQNNIDLPKNNIDLPEEPRKRFSAELKTLVSFNEGEKVIPEKETVGEVVLLEINMNCGTSQGLGLSIAGGIDSDPYQSDDRGVFIAEISIDSPADRDGLKEGDKIVKVNGRLMVGLTHDQAVDVMRRCDRKYDFVVERSSRLVPPNILTSDISISDEDLMKVVRSAGLDAKYPLKRVDLSRGGSGRFGITIHGGFGVSAIPFSSTDGGPFVSRVSNNNGLRVGHRILTANGFNVTTMTTEQIYELFSKYEIVSLIVSEDPIPNGYMSFDVKMNSGDRVGMTVVKGRQGLNGDGGIFIEKIDKEGVVAADGRLHERMRLISINDIYFFDISLKEAVNAISGLKSDFTVSACDSPKVPSLNYSIIKPIKSPRVVTSDYANISSATLQGNEDSGRNELDKPSVIKSVTSLRGGQLYDTTTSTNVSTVETYPSGISRNVLSWNGLHCSTQTPPDYVNIPGPHSGMFPLGVTSSRNLTENNKSRLPKRLFLKSNSSMTDIGDGSH